MSRTTRKQPEWILYGVLNAAASSGAPAAHNAGAQALSLAGASAHILLAEAAGADGTLAPPQRLHAPPCRP